MLLSCAGLIRTGLSLSISEGKVLFQVRTETTHQTLPEGCHGLLNDATEPVAHRSTSLVQQFGEERAEVGEFAVVKQQGSQGYRYPNAV